MLQCSNVAARLACTTGSVRKGRKRTAITAFAPPAGPDTTAKQVRVLHNISIIIISILNAFCFIQSSHSLLRSVSVYSAIWCLYVTAFTHCIFQRFHPCRPPTRRHISWTTSKSWPCWNIRHLMPMLSHTAMSLLLCIATCSPSAAHPSSSNK
jgi:hypothetical protein